MFESRLFNKDKLYLLFFKSDKTLKVVFAFSPIIVFIVKFTAISPWNSKNWKKQNLPKVETEKVKMKLRKSFDRKSFSLRIVLIFTRRA